MLSKKERLSREEFNRFFSIGKRSHSPTLQLVFSPHETLHASVVVSKKIAKSAVKRNKIRRRIYDIVRNYKKERDVHGVFIFFAKQNILSRTHEHLKDEVRACMDKAIQLSHQ